MPNKNKIRNFRKFIEQLSSTVDDETALEHPEAFHIWNIGIAYTVGDRVRYKDALFKVIQNHISQSDWTPDIAISLYVPVSAEAYPQWKQPTGAHDAYNKGDKVTYEAKHYESLIDANIWIPTTEYWKEV